MEFEIPKYSVLYAKSQPCLPHGCWVIMTLIGIAIAYSSK